jgi:hypothetical protein
MPKGLGIMPVNPRSERSLRSYAAHLALVMRGPSGGPWILFKRYGDRRRVSRSIAKPANVERAIRRWGERMAAGIEDPNT